MNKLLRFALGNAKLKKDTAIFSLPAGYTCIGAQDCLSRANRITGKIKDGPLTEFRCYAASSEALFSNIRKGRWNNFDTLKGKSVPEMAALINASLPKKIKLCRMHASGDFFSQAYFDAWVLVAKQNPNIVFYGYTKALPFLVSRMDNLPENFRLVASRGGKFDFMIEKYRLQSVTVVFSVKEAEERGLQIDHDDVLCWKQKKSFALLLHGTQPAKSLAGKALAVLRKLGIGGYKADYFAHYNKAK